MICSQNEITAVLYKAAVGSGLTVGLAQDLAKAGAWLCATGRPGLAISLDALESDIGAWCNCFELLASGVEESVKVEAPVTIELLHAFAHLAGSNYEMVYTIEVDRDGGAIVTCAPMAAAANNPVAAGRKSQEEIEIDQRDLERAQALAHKTYVPSSDASRLSGAGAGLTDND